MWLSSFFCGAEILQQTSERREILLYLKTNNGKNTIFSNIRQAFKNFLTVLKRTECFCASSEIACLKCIPFFYLKNIFWELKRNTQEKKNPQNSKQCALLSLKQAFFFLRSLFEVISIFRDVQFQNWKKFSKCWNFFFLFPKLEMLVFLPSTSAWKCCFWTSFPSLMVSYCLPKPRPQEKFSFFLFFSPLVIKSCTSCSLISTYYLHEKLTGIIYSFTVRHCAVDRPGWRMVFTLPLVKCSTASSKAQIRLFCQGMKSKGGIENILQKEQKSPFTRLPMSANDKINCSSCKVGRK